MVILSITPKYGCDKRDSHRISDEVHDSGFMSCFCRGVRLTPWLLRDEKPTGGDTLDIGMGVRHLLSRCMPVRS
jgi:hypothetical protein